MSAVDYAYVVWHTGLPGEQADSFESVQKTALNIIEQALADIGLETLHVRRKWQDSSFYQKILNPGHKLNHLLPEPQQGAYEHRQLREYPQQRLKTSRAKNTLITYDVPLVI